MAAKALKIALFSFLILFSANLKAQGLLSYFKLTADDTKYERFDRIAVDVYHNTFLNLPKGVEVEPYSVGISAYFYKDIPFGEKSRAAFAFGVGFSRYNIHNNGFFVEQDGYTNFNPIPDSISYRRNKLSFNYIDVPVEFRLRKVNGKHKFKFYPGFKAGVLVNEFIKWKTDNIKYKLYNTPNTMLYNYGPTLRLAWNKFAIYGFYSLTPFFEPGKGENIQVVALGISWIRF